jgi:DNA-directed RNA polymerase subunit RPC12/RpoP
MMFLYFVTEVVLAVIALIKKDISDDLKKCKGDANYHVVKQEIQKKHKISLILFSLLFIMSSFQFIDWFRMCSRKTGFQTLLGQDDMWCGLLCFANIVVAIACLIFIVGLVHEMVTDGLEKQIKGRLSKIGAVNSAIANLEKKYGKVSDIIRTAGDDTVLTNAIIRFDSSQNLFCQGRIIPYKDIIKCESYSIPIHKTTTKTVTKTSIGSTLGRAAVGGVIAGPVGAVIGGATGKKNSETVTEDVIERWEHKAVISLSSNQIISIPITSFVNYYDNNNKHIVLTEQEVVIRIASMVNKAVDIKNGLTTGADKTILLDGHNDTTYVCTLCGNNVMSDLQPAQCPTCGNTEFNIRYICSKCGYEYMSQTKPDKCPICNSRDFRY